MALYADGYVLVVPKRSVKAYVRLAKAAARVWRDHGALEVRECVGDDLRVPCGIPFPRLAKARKGETVFFSWITYRSRAHRDRVNARVMKDPRMNAMMPEGKKPPFDMHRMTFGGFRVAVAAG